MVEGSADLKLFEASEEIKKKPRTYATPKEKWERVYADADKGVKAHARLLRLMWRLFKGHSLRARRPHLAKLRPLAGGERRLGQPARR